jgi:hypothetical protein
MYPHNDADVFNFESSDRLNGLLSLKDVDGYYVLRVRLQPRVVPQNCCAVVLVDHPLRAVQETKKRCIAVSQTLYESK